MWKWISYTYTAVPSLFQSYVSGPKRCNYHHCIIFLYMINIFLIMYMYMVSSCLIELSSLRCLLISFNIHVYITKAWFKHVDIKQTICIWFYIKFTFFTETILRHYGFVIIEKWSCKGKISSYKNQSVRRI